MKVAQERLTKEMETSGELQIEDGGQQAEKFESPQAARRDVAKGSEDEPKSFMPPTPGAAPS